MGRSPLSAKLRKKAVAVTPVAGNCLPAPRDSSSVVVCGGAIAGQHVAAVGGSRRQCIAGGVGS